MENLPCTDATVKTELDPILEAALAYAGAGLSCIPDRQDTKAPAVPWKEFETKQAHVWQLHNWYPRYRLGIVCGYAGVEMLDFDLAGCAFEPWRAAVDPGLFAKLVIETTPKGGRHVSYRCVETAIPGNTKLAQRQIGVDDKGNPDVKVLIETRGKGGQFLCAPNAGYVLIQGTYTDLPVLTAAERLSLISAALALAAIFPCPRKR